MSSTRTFGVIGLGTFGSTIAADLTEAGDEVLGLDIAEGPVSRMANICREVVIADARDEKALEEAGFGQCDTAVVAIGNDLEANIVAVMNLKVLGVENVWAKATSHVHHRILSRLDVERVIHPEREMGQRVAQMLHNPHVRDYLSLGNGFYAMTFLIPESMAGSPLSDLRLGEDHNLKCLEVMRGSEKLDATNNDPSLEEDDRMLVLGKRTDLRAFSDSF